MKEFVYSFNGSNYYLDTMKKSAAFGAEEKARLIIEPHDYELNLSGEVLRKSSCGGYKAEITDRGEVYLLDMENNPVAHYDETQKRYREFRVELKQEMLCISFGHTETVDNYPDCDGEYDRWSTRWTTDYEVKIVIV